MGDHYVPQYYLKGFSQGSGSRIWVHDKQDGRKFATQIKSIANETGFYSPEVEQYLANTIEGPANTVLKKIRVRDQITDEDKGTLAEYMTVMMKRVPRSKERVRELMPSVAEELAQEINQQLKIVSTEQPEKSEFIQRRKSEIQEILDRFSKEPPKQIWLDNIIPEMSPNVVAAISSMNWRFLTFDEKPAFFTCDNPVFFFTGIGIGKPQSEVTLPISSHITLLATWKTGLSEGYFHATKQGVKEINRRTASNTTRFVFHCDDEDWILPFVTKNRWQLHLMQQIF